MTESNVVETLHAQNEALQAKNEALKVTNEVQKMAERERLNNHANWNKKSNKPWKKEVVRSYTGAGYTTEEIAGLFMVTEKTIKAHK